MEGEVSMKRLSSHNLISITFLFEDGGKRFTQTLHNGDAENWLTEVEHRLEYFYRHMKNNEFPKFNFIDSRDDEIKGVAIEHH